MNMAQIRAGLEAIVLGMIAAANCVSCTVAVCSGHDTVAWTSGALAVIVGVICQKRIDSFK